jgi:hypothetical protein
MKPLVISSAMLLMLAGGSAQAWAQQDTNQELYHVRFVKAAPGQLAALTAAELKAPPDPNNPEPPVILRHQEGDDWQLLVISPLGKDETIRAEQPNPALLQWYTQLRSLSVRHDDTIAQGPAWSEAKKVLLGDGQPNAVYIVSAFEPAPGHRDQLLTALTSGPGSNPSSTLVLTHREGAPWTFLTITRYASWTALGQDMDKQNAQTPGPTPASEHFATHHDTIAQRVAGASSPSTPASPPR